MRLSVLVLLTFFLPVKTVATTRDLPSHDIWIWPAAYVQQAKKVGASSVFVLQRHFDRNGRIETRGPTPWPWHVKDLTLVFRFATRPDIGQVANEFFALKSKWESKGVRVRGLQLDYDSPTAKLGFYQNDLTDLLRELRRQAPDQKLSVTGLSDWLTLKHAGFPSDVTVYFQFYRERRPHPENEMYLERLSNVNFPFKVGLLPNQTLTSSQINALTRSPKFRGFARFYGGTLL